MTQAFTCIQSLISENHSGAPQYNKNISEEKYFGTSREQFRFLFILNKSSILNFENPLLLFSILLVIERVHPDSLVRRDLSIFPPYNLFSHSVYFEKKDIISPNTDSKSPLKMEGLFETRYLEVVAEVNKKTKIQ